MSLNYKEIDAVLAELDLKDSFIQSIVQPGYDSLALYVYKSSYIQAKALYICLAAGECRIHETKRPIPKNKTPLRFMEFLKSRIKGAKIRCCRQIGEERIVEIELIQAQTLYKMFIRLWSGAANIVVTDEHLHILDVFYRRPKRGEVSGGTFVLPEQNSVRAQKTGTEPDNNFEKKDFKKRDFTAEEYAVCFKDIDTASLSFNEQLDIWYAEYGNTSSRTLLLAQAEKAYNQRSGRIQSALLKLEEKRQSFLNADIWKHQGDLILANAHTAESCGGTKNLMCIDYNTGKPVSIHIDPKKTAAENAAFYYEQYKKAHSGLKDLEKDIADLKEELKSVHAAYKAICAEENPILIRRFLQKQSAVQKRKEKKHPGLSFSLGEWHILVGRTAAENDELLRNHVKGLDWWLHTRDYAGGYVFIKNRRGKTVPLDVLIDAGNLAVFYSKARKAKTADLYYTQVKHLRRAKNAPKGTVLPAHEKNITVTLDNERIRKMEKMKNDD
ncbi:NFACT family protein [Treponema sp. OMZ 840]|uniref:NFACT RNA binding domain-containing protein n=1 Tax=Treponema sp. OMZ 840 TaxID=244313 RepID=UPI003D94828F